MHMGKSVAGMVCHFTPLSLTDRSYRITSLNYSPDGADVLVSYSSEYIYLFGTKVCLAEIFSSYLGSLKIQKD